MNAQRGKIVSGGRLLVPAEFRRALGLSDGDTVVMEVTDNELHVRPIKSALRRIQRNLRRYAPEQGSVADELIAERRAEAKRD
jgi:AbrB family looped-hinge helix DNA binding protein